MSFFEEKEFETKNINGDVIKEKKVLFHDTRTGFVGLADENHKKNNPEEYQKFLAETYGKDAKVEEEVAPVASDVEEAFEDKHASVPVDGDNDSEPAPGSVEDEVNDDESFEPAEDAEKSE